jgi:hypothetical protein
LHDSLVARGDAIFDSKEAEQDLRKFRFFRNIEIKNRALIKLTPWNKVQNGLFRGMKSFLVGTEFARSGARESIELKGLANEMTVYNSFEQELQNEDVMDIVNGDEHQEAFHDALMGDHVDDHRIRKAAEITKKHQDQLNRLLRREGVFIQEADRRGVRHFHLNKELIKTSDNIQQTLRDKSLTMNEKFEKAYQRWKSFVFKNQADTLLDLEKTKRAGISLTDMSDNEIDDFLRNSYTTISNGGKFTDVGKSMSQRLGARRILHFKDSESFVKYNRKFGVSTVGEAVKRELQSGAKNLSILQSLGDNPNAMLNRIMVDAVKDNPEFKFQFEQKARKRKLENLLDEVMGTFNDSSSAIARIGANIRSFNNITNLGKVLFAAVTDLAPVSLEGARLTGSWGSGIAEGLKNIMGGQTRALNKEVSKLINVYTHSDIGGATRWFSADDAPANIMQKAQRLQWKLSLMRWWDESHRSGIATLAAKSLADHRHLGFDAMKRSQAGRDTITSMEQYGIDSDMWDLIRNTPVSDVQGRQFITSDSVKNVSDQSIREFLQKKGALRITKTAIQDIKDEVQQKMNMYFHDRVDHAILRPSAADRQFWFQGTNSGTAAGQLMRMLGQYKQYSTAFISKPIARLLYGRGAESWQQALIEGKGDRQGMAMLIGYATLLGYIGTAANSISDNETPPSPFSERGFMESFQRGGGLGLYTNVLTSDPNQFGQGVIQQLEGPTLSKGSQAFNAFMGMFHNSTSRGQLLRVLKSNTPLANTFYTKWALDYLIFNRLQEQANPGYYAKKLAQLQQNHQNFLFSPI